MYNIIGDVELTHSRETWYLYDFVQYPKSSSPFLILEFVKFWAFLRFTF